jgi:hypothetical protein
MLFNLVEKTAGPWHGKVWRSEEMTAEEAAGRNGKIEVVKWEPAGEPEQENEASRPVRRNQRRGAKRETAQVER